MKLTKQPNFEISKLLLQTTNYKLLRPIHLLGGRARMVGTLPAEKSMNFGTLYVFAESDAGVLGQYYTIKTCV